MTLNNRTFTLLKIVLLIIISIFIAEIIVLPKIEHDMLQEAGRQELVTVQQICGAVLENYPDVEQDFILGLRQPTNSLQEKGEQILKQYGYDEEHLLADNCHPEKVFAEETVFVLYGFEISERKKSFFPTTRCFCCEKAVRRCF